MDFPTLERLLPWHWWVLGGLLLLVELLMPGVVFVWLGIAAFGVGLLSFILPLSVPEQLLVFAGLSVAVVWLGRWYVSRLEEQASTQPNQGGRRLIGRRVTVTVAIPEGGIGRVRVGDSDWRATGTALAPGSAARVIGVSGTTLVVEAYPLAEGPGTLPPSG